MNINVLGPTYPDNSNEEAPSPLQIAMLFKENGTIPSEPISLQPSATDEWYINNNGFVIQSLIGTLDLKYGHLYNQDTFWSLKGSLSIYVLN